MLLTTKQNALYILAINSENVIQIESKLFLIVSHSFINFKFIFNLVLHNITNIRQLFIFHGEFSRFVKSKKIVGLSGNVDKSIFHI